jgi:hypothetical protein
MPNLKERKKNVIPFIVLFPEAVLQLVFLLRIGKSPG